MVAHSDDMPPPSRASVRRLEVQDRPSRALNAPMPNAQGFMSEGAAASLAELAYKLRDEQLEARIVHYREDLQTNAELDAITAQVAAELRALQQNAQVQRNSLLPAMDPATHEREIAEALSLILGRVFKKEKLSIVLERKLAEISKRFARLFFRSELHERITANTSAPRVMRFPEQALYHMFVRAEEKLVAELESLHYSDPAMVDDSVQMLAGVVKEFRDKFLSKTTPELNELLRHLTEILRSYLTWHLPGYLPELAKTVARDAQLGSASKVASYKVSSGTFPIFRRAFETKLLAHLVPFVEAAMLERVRSGSAKFRRETLEFVAEPRIFSDVCELLSDTVYDLLYSEGFLDLPTDWRAKMTLE
jgi:hypothetical protein